MNKLDKELGFSNCCGDDFSSADGKVAARAAYEGCKKLCDVKNACCGKKVKANRAHCKSGCLAKYNAKMVAISAQVGAQDASYGSAYNAAEAAALAQQEGSQGLDSAIVAAKEVDNAKSVSAKSGMSTGAKVGITLGVVALIVGAVILIKKRK